MSNVTNPCVPSRDSNWAGRLRSATAAARRLLLLLLLTLGSGNVSLPESIPAALPAERGRPPCPQPGDECVVLSLGWRGDKQLLGKRGARHSSALLSVFVPSCIWDAWLHSPSVVPLNPLGLGSPKQNHSGVFDWGVAAYCSSLPPQKCSGSAITCISTCISSTMEPLEYLSHFLPACVGCVTPPSLLYRCPNWLRGKTNCSEQITRSLEHPKPLIWEQTFHTHS